MKKVILLNKKEGETPLESLEVFRASHKSYKDAKLTYAGRLDPMARGLLLVLAGEEVKNKEKYLALDKVYEFEVLFGFATDTYDILGKVTDSAILTNSRIDLKKKIKSNLKFFRGKLKQKYPLYSSPNIKKVLKGEEVESPERDVSIKSLKFKKLRKISAKNFFVKNKERIKKVQGEFRQSEIIKVWDEHYLTNKLKFYYVASFEIKCTSGTYVRGIAHDLGVKMDVPALAYTIKRTKVGKWSL